MIDNIKITVTSADGKTWLISPLLSFVSYVDEVTGAVVGNTRVAYFKGLRFIITKSNKYEDTYYYSVRGSLPKYWNDGKHNAYDFGHNELVQVLADLNEKFNINLETSTIHNIEFGVNISTTATAKKIVNSLISAGSEQFYGLKIEDTTVGKKIEKQRYQLKVYDKGLQAKTGNTNLLRIELSIKKMDYLKEYNIKTLSDLADPTNTNKLLELLLNEWQKVLMYGQGMKILKGMSEFSKRKFLYYLRPTHWVEFNSKQRCKAKNHFKTLIAKHSEKDENKEIYNLISGKWKQLSNEKRERLNHDLTESKADKKGTFEPLVCSSQTYPLVNPNKEKEEKEKKEKKRKCISCESDISNQRKDSVFCSVKFQGEKAKKCRNKNSNHRSNLKRKIMNEKKMKLSKRGTRPKREKFVRIVYVVDGMQYADILKPSEIQTSNKWLNRIKRVECPRTGETYSTEKVKQFLTKINK